MQFPHTPLPAQLTLVGASADAGSISTDPASNSVFWNGALASGASVTILIQADVAITAPATISNQASIHFDSDGDGLNDAAALSSDPTQPGTDVPTRFQFAGAAAPASPVIIPATGRAALLWMMALMLIGAGLWRALRQRGRPQTPGRVIEGEYRHARTPVLPQPR